MPLECQPRVGAHVTLPIFHIIGRMRHFGGVLWPQGATDGNAIFEHAGVFHIMHQTSHDTPAGATVPKHSDWGHVVSHDLVHWARVDDALQPTASSASYDWHDGDCDGTVTFDSNGLSDEPIMTFGPDCARGLSNDAPRVGFARPANASDPFLEAWVKDPANPIDFGNSTPCSFSGRVWRSSARGPRGHEHINMICAINAKGNQWGRYTSTNATLHGPWTLADPSFATWEGPVGGGPHAEGSISAPSFLPLAQANKTHEAADAPGQPTHLINGGGGAAYWLGTYNPQKERLRLSGSLQKVEGGLANWFVAGVSERDGRVLHVGFLEPLAFNSSDPRGFKHTCYDEGWLCPLSSVRELTFDAPTRTLVANPVAEYAALRNRTLVTLPHLALASGATPHRLRLPPGAGATMDLELRLELPASSAKEAVSIRLAVLSSPAEITAEMEVEGAAAPPTPTKAAHTGTHLTLTISPTRGNGTRAGLLLVEAPRIRYARNMTFELAAGVAQCDLRLLVDRSIVEAFAAGGRAVISTRDYPAAEDLAASVSSSTGATLSVSAWEMGCGWVDRDTL